MAKANQNLKQNDEAVSPVIGVILMVAITVVLAAVVFVLVSNLGKSSNSAPTFALGRDDATDRLSVTSADSDADWNRLAVKANGTGSQFRLNCATGAPDAAAGSGCPLQQDVTASNTEFTASADLMSAGEFVEFCAETAAAALVPYTYTIVDTSANQVIGTFTFNNVALCT